ncbi:hypothetical protein TcWFU_004610 [Taenia crassiceps]|uniref:MANSC domain-containing protein n=1 Tax=Taenia crassiceps TaxID=6207 RepID=A0ABR4Q1K6_9CEST
MFLTVVQLLVLFTSASSRKCDEDFDIRLNTVVLTHVSENNGAVFIHKLSAVSLEDCVKYCCDTIECTVGVFGPKQGGKCFLFNCYEPNLCNFTYDPDHTVFVQRTWPPEPPNVHKVTTWPSGTLLGFCGLRNPCIAENSICDSGRCICKSGFIEKRRKCVPSLCSKPELEFQCDDATACIAVYDVCNGIAECADASDELFCEKEPPESASTQKVQSRSSPGLHILNARALLPRGDDERGLSDVGFEHSKARSLRTLHFGHDSPTHRAYEGKGDYFPPSYLTSALETGVPSLMLADPRRKSIFPVDSVSTFLERPERLRSPSGYRSHFSGSSQFSNDDASLEHNRQKIGRLSTQARHALVEDFDGRAGDYNVPHYGDSSFDREHKPLRHRVRPLAEHSDLKSGGKHRTDKYHAEAKNSEIRPKIPTASAIDLYTQSGYQWHTAAVLLAVGLGLTSCLFGLLVGRCRQRGRFDQEGPRSKAVATSHLRQRILRTRGLSNNDLERSGLLSKLQL